MPQQHLSDDIDELEVDIIEYRERAESWIEEALLSAREATRHRPVGMLIAAAGIGVLMGLIVGR